jgi:hypothetical protein
MSLRPVGESIDEVLENMKRPPLVAVVDGYFEFYLDGEKVYDFEVCEPGRALRWAEHMAQKSWVTKRHLEDFVRLAADAAGARYV